MTTGKQRLELTWVGKEDQPRLEPRIILEEPSLSYSSGRDQSADNRLIFGDNLLAIKALEVDFRARIKCIYIDPPYNTGSAFEHYDDAVEHSVWLSLMRDRLALLRDLLTDSGSIWINIDDNEAHYCKVLCDEVFGRKNFVANVIWEKADSPRMDAEFFSSRHDHILAYAKDISKFSIKKGVGYEEAAPEHYNKIDEQGRRYYLKPLRAMGGDDARADRPSMFFPMTAPDGTQVVPIRKDGSEGRWRWSEQRTKDDSGLIEWVSGRDGWSPYYRVILGEASKRPPETIWPHWDVGSNRTSKAETKALFGGSKSFQTPKPERLLERVIALTTEVGEWVLDSFAGSGTTGAVAHKMGRRWIMIELGEHCHTHIIPRMKKVINGDDLGGITEAVGWKGGGGFRYYRLAPSLLKKDKWSNWVISDVYNPEMLAEAMCKHMGFTYAPSETDYWNHGYSSERDFIYVTTTNLADKQLAALSDEVGQERSLLICCKAFHAPRVDRFANLTVKKIPQAVLDRCEWGRDDYSLNVAAAPPSDDDAAPDADPAPAKRGRKRKEPAPAAPGLFDEIEG